MLQCIVASPLFRMREFGPCWLRTIAAVTEVSIELLCVHACAWATTQLQHVANVCVHVSHTYSNLRTSYHAGSRAGDTVSAAAFAAALTEADITAIATALASVRKTIRDRDGFVDGDVLWQRDGRLRGGGRGQGVLRRRTCGGGQRGDDRRVR